MILPGQARKAADRFIAAQIRADNAGGVPCDRTRLLDGCTAHLVASLRLVEDEAQHVALTVIAEYECAGTRCFIDLSRSTAHLVHLVDPVTGQAFPLTVADLLRFLGPRGAAVPPTDRRRITRV